MTTRRDAYWDELGVAWCAIDPDVNVIAPRLSARLRRQSLVMTAGLVAGVPLSAGGMLLGVLTIWRGWTTGAWHFISRGAAIGAISVVLAIAVSLLRAVRASDAARAVSEMVDLAIARAQRTLVMIRLGLSACTIAAVSGLVGTVIRTSLTGPPRMSPVVDLAVLVVIALGLFFYGRHTRVELEKLRALKHALAMDGERQ
jgi:hypothetical protein